jgi:CubicO group peptidase (beta-lactamase class C family)
MADTNYFPPAGAWERAKPESVGLDPATIRAAADFAVAQETLWPRSINDFYVNEMKEPPPWNKIIGPVRDRGGPSGVILRGGRIVAEWGDIERADMTFSVTKSYVSTCVGLAQDAGLIKDLDAPVRDLVDDGGFDSAQNRPITWKHLLQQTSEWEGTLWDKPDLVDRNRVVGAGASTVQTGTAKGTDRKLQKPGSYWEYNDVRVNRLSLAAMRVWRRALPDLLKEKIMNPIGASPRWEWHGYENSWVEIDGKRMQSVSGGAHWGGGLFISSLDHARLGYLFLRRGNWAGRQLLSADWIGKATQPCAINPHYGFMWWLNSDGKAWPGVSRESFMALGAGSSLIWVDPTTDIVAVARWIKGDAIPAFVARIAKAVRE